MNKLRIKLNDAVCIILIAIGVFLRSAYYLQDQSLWLDEAYVAREIDVKSFQEILTFRFFLKEQPRSPIFFQALSKLFTVVFGNHDWALRLTPFLCSLANLGLFFLLLRRMFSSPIMLLALGLFVLNPVLSYYGSELKPYSSDITAMLILYHVFFLMRDRQYTIGWVRLFSLIVVLMIFFSIPSILIIGGIFLTILAPACYRKNFVLIHKMGIPILLVLGATVLNYINLFRPMMASTYIHDMWAGSFLPLENGIIASMKWIISANVNIFWDLLKIQPPLIGFILFGFGIGHLSRTKGKNICLLFLSPLMIAFLAACLNKYPYKERMLLFLVPILCLFVSAGIVAVAGLSKRYGKILLVILSAVALFNPLVSSWQFLVDPPQKEENRLIMQIIKNRFQDGDKFFFNNSAQYTVHYYLNSLIFTKKFLKSLSVTSIGQSYYELKMYKIGDIILEYQGKPFMPFRTATYVNSNGHFMGYFEKLKDAPHKRRMHEKMDPKDLPQGRVWLILSHIHNGPKDFIIRHFDIFGKRLEVYRANGAELYLYDFKK
ncbi:MAG TPA: glycosyltransferase family 39 protein [Candidatus Omnitrophota bacterium]|nr:glycosyltransferase family 39 protein [Candidatus Omnitrophota bacterium]